MAVCVDRCVCTGRRFAELVALARQCGWSGEQLAEHTRAGRSCGLCRPYLARALRTGEVVFHELLVEAKE